MLEQKVSVDPQHKITNPWNLLLSSTYPCLLILIKEIEQVELTHATLIENLCAMIFPL